MAWLVLAWFKGKRKDVWARGALWMRLLFMSEFELSCSSGYKGTGAGDVDEGAQSARKA